MQCDSKWYFLSFLLFEWKEKLHIFMVLHFSISKMKIMRLCGDFVFAWIAHLSDHFFVVQPLHRLTKRCKWMRNMKLLSIIYQWSQLFVSLLDEKNDFCFHLLYINVDILLLYQKQLRYGNCDNKDDCELRYFTFFFLCSVKEIHFWHMIM